MKRAVVAVLTASAFWLLFLVLSQQVEAHHPEAIPQEAYRYKRFLTKEAQFYCGLLHEISLSAAQIHAETGQWDRNARSPVGAQGLGQVMPGTGIWLVSMYPKDLEGEARPLDPFWAIRALLLYDCHYLWKQFAFAATLSDHWALIWVAYNGGAGNLLKERKHCIGIGLVGCDPRKWFGNIELFCLRKPAACEENRGYPVKIIRLTKLYHDAGW